MHRENLRLFPNYCWNANLISTNSSWIVSVLRVMWFNDASVSIFYFNDFCTFDGVSKINNVISFYWVLGGSRFLLISVSANTAIPKNWVMCHSVIYLCKKKKTFFCDTCMILSSYAKKPPFFCESCVTLSYRKKTFFFESRVILSYSYAKKPFFCKSCVILSYSYAKKTFFCESCVILSYSYVKKKTFDESCVIMSHIYAIKKHLKLFSLSALLVVTGSLF